MDIYEEISNRIIAELEAGSIPWQKGWVSCCGSCAVSHTTGRPYSILNQMLLGKPGEYITFQQAHKEGGHVRKGAHSKMVVFWKFIEKEDEETGEKETVPMLRYYSVFHLDDTEGIKPKFDGRPVECGAKPDEVAENIITDYITRSGVRLKYESGDRAFYSPVFDSITVPKREQFKETAEFYGTVFHEMTHSTGHATRLNRLSSTAFFGNEAYSKEELVAEIGSAVLVNHCGLETAKSFRNSAAYIQSWLKALRDDKRLIVSAAGKAEKAVVLILGNEKEPSDQQYELDT